MFFLLVLSGTTAQAQTIFGPGLGGIYGTGTGSGHGGAVTPYVLSSSIFADVPAEWRVAKIESLSVRGWVSSDVRSLQIAIHNSNEVAVLQSAMPTGANVNGDYTFVDDSSLPTISDVAASLTDGQTVPSGTYRMSGGALVFGNPGNLQDLSHFDGSPVRPGWTLLFLNYSLQNTGRFDSWTATVTVNPVPEPATIAGLASGIVMGLRPRRTR